MHIISKKRLREFWGTHSNSEESLRGWFQVVRKVEWETFTDIRATYNSADIYEDCVIFNIGGNKFRLIAKVRYKIKRVYVRAVLTHAEYDRGKWKEDCER